VLPAPHAQVRAAPFDRGYAVQDVVRDETSTRGKFQAREKVEPFRSVYVPFVQRYDASSVGSDHRDIQKQKRTMYEQRNTNCFLSTEDVEMLNSHQYSRKFAFSLGMSRDPHESTKPVLHDLASAECYGAI